MVALGSGINMFTLVFGGVLAACYVTAILVGDINVLHCHLRNFHSHAQSIGLLQL